MVSKIAIGLAATAIAMAGATSLAQERGQAGGGQAQERGQAGGGQAQERGQAGGGLGAQTETRRGGGLGAQTETRRGGEGQGGINLRFGGLREMGREREGGREAREERGRGRTKVNIHLHGGAPYQHPGFAEHHHPRVVEHRYEHRYIGAPPPRGVVRTTRTYGRSCR